jgi:DNA polymerase-3 subunit delta'
MSDGAAAREVVTVPVLDGIVGQEWAKRLLASSVRSPVHAYLFVGPAGSGRRDAARRFAAALVCPDGGCGTCPSCRSALAEAHPDVVVTERRGAAISVDEAREVVLRAQLGPRAAPRQVLVLVDVHLVGAAAPALLKAVEEPPPTTVFVLLAESVPPALGTLASRCMRVDFAPLDEEEVASVLRAEGVPEDRAREAARAAGGRLDRARLLAVDANAAARLERWQRVPEALDGSGATLVTLARELLSGAEEPVALLRERQAAELRDRLDEARRLGERALPGRATIEERHRREQRRARTDELRAGLGALAQVYRERLAGTSSPRRARAALLALEAVEEASRRLSRNVNEQLLLEWLLLRLESGG